MPGPFANLSAIASVRIAIAALAGVLAPLAAADGLAIWAHGTGRLDGATAAAWASTPPVVGPGQLIEAGYDLVRLELIGFAGSDIILGAGAAARLAIETTPEQAGPVLVLQVERGAVAVDVSGSGPYAAVVARGAALESRSTGADFILERGADADYVALTKGLLLVHLRAGLADADGMALQLQARQGLAASAAGLSEVDQLNTRPQLGRGLAIQAQAVADGDGDGDWSNDEAAFLTDDPEEDGTLTRGPDPAPAAIEPQEPAPPQVAASDRRPIPVPIVDEPAPAADVDDPAAEPPAAPSPAADAGEGRVVARHGELISADDLRRAAGARGAAVFLR